MILFLLSDIDLSIEEALLADLESCVPITDIVSTKIYPFAVPQNQVLPYITYFRTGTDRLSTLSDVDGFVKTSLQLDLWCSTKSQVYLLNKLVRQRLNSNRAGTLSGIPVNITITQEIDLDEFEKDGSDKAVYRKSLDLEIYHYEEI